MNFCPNCGSKLTRPGEDQFCMNCGAKIPAVQPEPAAPVQEQTPAVESTAFAGVPITPPQEESQPASASGQQPRGEDLLNLIEEAQGQAASYVPPAAPAGQPQDLFAENSQLFTETPSPPATGDMPAEAAANLFSQSAPPQDEQNMFGTTIMQSVKPPPQESHPKAPERPAAQARPAPPSLPKQAAAAPPQQGDLFAAAAPPPQAEQQPDMFGQDAAQPAAQPDSLFDGPREAQPGQDDLFDTASMLAQEANDPLFAQSSRQPTPARAPAPPPVSTRRAPVRSETHSQTGQRPRASQRTAPLPLRASAFEDTQSQPDTAKPRRVAPPPVNLPEPAVEIKKPSVIGRVLTAFAVLIIFLVVCAATILVMLYFRNRPSQTIDAFTEAITTGDVTQLNKLATVQGVSPTDEQWAAFCAAFSTTTDLNTLKSQLLVMSEEENGGDSSQYAYPAVTIEGKPFILFIERYTINIQSVSLLAPGAADGTVVRLGEVDTTGTLQADGMLYTGLMPGSYQCRVVPPGVMPENVPPVDIEIFGVAGPNYLEGEAPRVAVTISNCASDDAILYVNDQPVAERPVGGVVTIPNVQLGSTIRISAIKDGATMDASVVFNDLNTTQLAFADYTQTGEPAPASSEGGEATITADEINAVLGTFYQSYLECINQQSIAGIQNTTTAANTEMESRIKSTNNAGNLYQYTSVAVDAESIKTTTSGDLPAVHFNAQFQFSHKPRDTEEDYTATSNYQTVEMVFQDGKWLVNKMTFVNEGDFGNHVLATFQ